MRLPPATAVPAQAARVVRTHLRLRFGLFFVAWALISLRWFNWEALPFEAAIAGAVLWHAVRRERLLQMVDGKRVQLELVTSVGRATADATDPEDLLARATEQICRTAEWTEGRVWLPEHEGAHTGLHGRAFELRAPVRERAPGNGTSFGLPVLAGGDVVAVLAFSSPESKAADDALFDALALVGAQLGQILKRTWAEAHLRDAEERYRALVETLPLATYVDRPGHVTGAAWVSPQIAEITSYGAEEWMADHDLLQKVLHPDDRRRVIDEMARIKETGEPLDHEYRMIRRDGSVVWVHDSAVTVELDGLAYTRGFIIDVTDRREAELERDETLARELEQNEQLRELDGLKDEFVALVSHELRTPLTSIRGYLELITEDTNLTAEQTHFLDTIDRNAQRLQRVVGDLLFLAQVEAGKLALENGSVDVNAIVEESLSAARPSAQAKAIELHADLDELPQVPGDRARLAQVLDNFVSNAIKFTPGSGTVRLTTRLHGDEIEIAVSDTGMGIPAADLPKLFQRFFRTERATSGAIPGTGLGLAIARAIVEGHGGRIGVESEEGVCTTFRVFLPTSRT
jgi:PAS domain S-box-containing protein